jgi:hypothetical protein
MQHEGIALMKGLADAATSLDGKVITSGIRNGERLTKALRCSAKTLYKEWRRWQEGECQASALILNYKPGKSKIPEALAAEIQRRTTLKTGGVNKDGLTPISDIYHWLCDDFANRRPIPGINYDLYPAGAEFPFHYATVVRAAPGKAERALGNRGVAAFKARAAHVTMDYSQLRKCELFTLDDVRLDLLCVNDLGKAVTVKCYVLMEVASRYIVAFFLKPEADIKQEDVDELIAHGLQAPGFGVGRDYPTHILFERGTVACSDAAQVLLEGVTQVREGDRLARGLVVHKTSMNGGITWVGSDRDRASGNACGKGVIESFMRRLHAALRRYPGQIGNKAEHAPASVGFGAHVPGSLIAETERLAKFAADFARSGKGRLKLQLPMLRVREVQVAVKEAIDKHNHEPGHKYADHGQFAQEEVEPGVWRSRNEEGAA